MTAIEYGSPLFPLQFCFFEIEGASKLMVGDYAYFPLQRNPFFHENALFQVTGLASETSWLLKLIDADYHAPKAPLVLPFSVSNFTVYRTIEDMESSGYYDILPASRYTNILEGLEDYEVLESVGVADIKRGDVIPFESPYNISYFRQTQNLNPKGVRRGKFLVGHVMQNSLTGSFVKEGDDFGNMFIVPMGDSVRYDVWRKPATE